MLLPLLAQWVLVANHTHTIASVDGSLRVADLAREAGKKGVHAVVVTDHNSVGALRDPAFRAAGPVTLIEGQEWGVIFGMEFAGHIGVMGLQGDFAISPAISLEEAVAEGNRRGALTVINHPFNFFLAFRGTEMPAGVGGVEIWNQPWHMWGVENARALEWWDAALRTGRRCVAVGGSDVHGLPFLGSFGADALDQPINLVLVEDASAESIVAGFQAGRVAIARDAAGPRLDLHAGAAGIGDEVAASGSLAVRVDVAGGRGLVLSLHSRAGKVLEREIGEDPQAVEARIDVAAGHDFIRAELREPAGWPEPAMAALTNPVYVTSE